MTDEKMTDEEWAKSYALGLAYSQKDPEMNNFLLGDSFTKMKHEIAKECLAEGRKRAAEESKERESRAAWSAWYAAKTQEGCNAVGVERFAEWYCKGNEDEAEQLSTKILAEINEQQREGREK